VLVRGEWMVARKRGIANVNSIHVFMLRTEM